MVQVRLWNCPCSEEKIGLCPHTAAPIMENPDYWEYGRLDESGESLWSLHHVDPPGQRMFDPNALILMWTHPSTQHFARYVEAQTIRQTTAKEVSKENWKIQAHPAPERMRLQGGGVQTVWMNIQESAHADDVTTLDTFHPNVLPGMTVMPWDRGFPRRLKRRSPSLVDINAGNVPSTTPWRNTVLTYPIHDPVWVNVKHVGA